MKIVVSGASGMVGSALIPRLRESGHDVVQLVRREPRHAHEVRWDPAAGRLDPADLEGADAAIGLSGAGPGDRHWTAKRKRVLRDSRVDPTLTLATALAALEPRPKVLLVASASGWYGDRGEEVLTEESGPGDSFLAGILTEGEAAARPAEDAGIRTVCFRSGIILSRTGGAFGRRMLPVFKVCLGGKLSHGRQYWAWITLHDHVRAVLHLLDSELAGPVNLTAPEPVPNAEVTRALGRAMHRPTVFTAPRLGLKVGVGGFTEEILSSQRVVPRALLDDGFVFDHPDIDTACRWLVSI